MALLAEVDGNTVMSEYLRQQSVIYRRLPERDAGQRPRNYRRHRRVVQVVVTYLSQPWLLLFNLFLAAGTLEEATARAQAKVKSASLPPSTRTMGVTRAAVTALILATGPLV